MNEHETDTTECKSFLEIIAFIEAKPKQTMGKPGFEYLINNAD